MPDHEIFKTRDKLFSCFIQLEKNGKHHHNSKRAMHTSYLQLDHTKYSGSLIYNSKRVIW